VTLDAAGVEGINVASDKTLLGLDVNTVLNGKGLRFVGVSNIIIQNIEITNLNPQYVWGGDAFVFSDTDLI
jgi:pectin lyase